MKKLKLTKVIASTLVLASVLALNPISASAAWKSDSTGWWYTDESSWTTGWKLLDGNWYYFNSDGYMAHDTTVDGYNLGSNGALIQKIVLATVGTEEITKDALDKEMNKYNAKLKQQYGDDYATNDTIKNQLLKLKKQELNSIVAEKILLKKATELNLKPADDEINNKINDAINQYKANYPQDGQFENLLKQNSLTLDQLKESIKTQVIVGAVEKDILKDLTVTDDEVQAYYSQNKDTTYTISAGATVSHILVANEETAKSLRAKLDAGADFATLAKENSIDPGTKNNGGNLGFIPYDSTELVPEFMNGFKNLKENEISAPVKSAYGYHLIKVTGLKDSEVLAFDKVKEQIKASLLQHKQSDAFNSKISQWKIDLNVKTYEDKL